MAGRRDDRAGPFRVPGMFRDDFMVMCGFVFRSSKLTFQGEQREEVDLQSPPERSQRLVFIADLSAVLLAHPDDAAAFLARAGAGNKFETIGVLREALFE